MSAMNIVISREPPIAFVLTDSLAYTPLRRVSGFAAKVHTFPHAKALLTGRGNAVCINRLVALFGRCADFDEMVEVLRTGCARHLLMRITRVIDVMLAMLRRPSPCDGRARGVNPIELCLVGYSRSAGRIKAVAASNQTQIPFDLLSSDALLAPRLPSADVESHRLSNDLKTWPLSLLSILECQREYSLQNARDEMIGGAAVLTTLTEDGITQRVIHRWPDKIGDDKAMLKSRVA